MRTPTFRNLHYDLVRGKSNSPYWFDKVKDIGFNLPETKVLPLNPKLALLIAKQKSEDKVIQLLQKYFLRSEVVNNFFSTHNKIFIKTDVSCNKSNFQDCICTDINTLGEVFYRTATFGLKQYNLSPTVLVLRQYIEPDVNLGTVRNGQAIASVFRVFFNFTSKRFIDVFDYWEVSNPKYSKYSTIKEIQEYNYVRPILDARFSSLLPYLLREIMPALHKTNLSDLWSLDFMYNDDKFYLLDMALGQNNYYLRIL